MSVKHNYFVSSVELFWTPKNLPKYISNFYKKKYKFGSIHIIKMLINVNNIIKL